MRNQPNLKIEQYRSEGPPRTNSGFFLIPRRRRAPHVTFVEMLRVMVSDGCGWDHVSISLATRCPTHEEMAFVKELFFKDEEWCVHFYPAKESHINCHPYCLHIWRPQTPDEQESIRQQWAAVGECMPPYDPPGAIPIPPAWMVAPPPSGSPT